MARKPLNHIQYVAELNHRLWADPEFCEGMEFKVYSDGTIGGHLRDADAMGTCRIPAVFARIEREVAARFEVMAPVPEAAESAFH